MEFKLVDGTIERVGDWPEDMSVEAALEFSIQKWEFGVKCIKAGKVVAGDGANDTCGLCAIFFEGNCFGCPVMGASGALVCHNTPYDDWAMGPYRSPLLLGVAEAELEFLKGLRSDS